MAVNRDFRLQTGSVTTPPAGVVSYWVDASGVQQLTNSAGTTYVANTLYKNTSVSGLSAGAAGAITGGAVLGSVGFWITGNVNGVKVVIPAYIASF